jgi:hypothetical protein
MKNRIDKNLKIKVVFYPGNNSPSKSEHFTN